MNPRIFALVCVLLGGMGQGVVSPKLPELLGRAADLSLASGISATLMYLGIFVSTYRYGKLADRGRVHWLLGPGLLLYAVTLVALSAVREPAGIYAIRLFEGLALSAIYVAADFLLGRLSAPGERARWLSYYGVALSAGLLLGPLLALAAREPARGLGVVAALAAALAVLAARLRVTEAPPAGPPPERLNLAALASGSAYGFMESALVAVFPVLAAQEFRVPPEHCLIVVILAAAGSSVPWGIAGDRGRPGRIVRALLLLLASGPTALALARAGGAFGSAATAYAACTLFGVIAGGLYPLGFAWLLEGLPEAHYGHASGSFARAYGLGSLIGPLAAGVAAQLWGSTGLFAALSACGLAASAFVARAGTRRAGVAAIRP